MKKTKIKVAFQDQRGLIKDLFYKEQINHVAHITTKKKALLEEIIIIKKLRSLCI